MRGPLRRPGTPSKRANQAAQRPHTLRVQHRNRPVRRLGRQHIGGIGTDRARTAIGQVHNQEQHPFDPPKTLRSKQLPEQRVRRGGHPHLTRQHRTKMLQSVAITPGVGKTHLASALGHIGIRRKLSVHFARADKLFTRLRAARLDNTLEAEMRRLARVDLLILDDFALRPLDATQTSDFYEIVVERHRKASTIVTSNREPAEWLTMTSDALLAQSAVDRLTSGAHTLIVEGPSYRQRDQRTRRVTVDPTNEAHDAH